MKEILYIQAGSFANFIGTHFWNTQESYFTYEDGDDPVVYHDRSFREGVTTKGVTTYCPRLLLFDRKSHFGALSDALYGSEDTTDVSQWGGSVVEFRHDPIPKSKYHARLDEGELEDAQDDSNEDEMSNLESVRFWSDYSRVYLHPRTVQKLPDLPDWERTDGDWSASRESFHLHEKEHEVIENELRSFIEECDEIQGIQIMSDCKTFGGFTDALLTAFRDEYEKLPSLAFSCLSDASRALVSADDSEQAIKAINDALCLRNLETLSTLNVPIQEPSTWRRDVWLDGLNLNPRTPYHTSALLSTHIETATLPFRLKNSAYDMSSLNDLLNLSGTTRTVHMAGLYPIPVSNAWATKTEKRIYDLSVVADGGNVHHTEYARLHVSRGLRANETPVYDELFSAKAPSPLSIHAPAYPTPTSFPRFFSPAADDSTTAAEHRESRHRALTSLTSTAATSGLFSNYARLAQECVDRRAEVVTRMGLEFDEVRELKDDLWALCDQYGAEGGEDAEEEHIGEDEEFV